MAGVNDLLELLGVGSRNVTERDYSPEIWSEINKMTPLTSAGKEARASNQPENQPLPESQSGGGGGPSIFGVLEGVLSGMRGDPYGPANQRINQMKMALALKGAKENAEKAKLEHELLKLHINQATEQEQLMKSPLGPYFVDKTKTVTSPSSLPSEFGPEWGKVLEGTTEISPESGPTKPGVSTEVPTGGFKLKIGPNTPTSVLKLLQQLFPEQYNEAMGIQGKLTAVPRGTMGFMNSQGNFIPMPPGLGGQAMNKFELEQKAASGDTEAINQLKKIQEMEGSSKTYGPLDQAAMAKFKNKYSELPTNQKEEIDALVYGKGSGPIADAVKQVTGGKKQWYSQLNPDEAKAVDGLVQKQAFNVQFGGQMGSQEGGIAGSQYLKWTQEQKNQSFENYIVNKVQPTFPWRDPGRTKWWQDYNQYLIDKGTSAESVGEKQYYRKAMGDSLVANEKYYGATKRFVTNIDDLSRKYMELRKQYGVNFGKLVNTGLNNLRQGIPGSGELANLQQYLTSISLEVAKVESGELGIQAATESQQKLWAKIHNMNFDVEDIDKVLKASQNLGAIRLKNLEVVRNDFRLRLSEKEPAIPGKSMQLKKEPSFPQKKNAKIVEIRETSSGKSMARYSDGTIEYELESPNPEIPSGSFIR